MTYKLFVYGTLKKGSGNHHLLSDAEYLGEAYVDKGFGLVVDGLPFLLEDKNGPGCYGELYNVTAEQLRACDRLEGHPTVYFRKEVSTYDLETGHEVKAFVYVYPHKKELRELGGKFKFIRRF